MHIVILQYRKLPKVMTRPQKNSDTPKVASKNCGRPLKVASPPLPPSLKTVRPRFNGQRYLTCFPVDH